jgi:maleylpyruvate isomerase
MRATSSSRGTDRISSNHPSERPRLMPNSAETATSARSWGRSTPCAVIPAAALAADVRGSADGFSAAADGMPAQAWQRTVRWTTGHETDAALIVPMRLGEVLVHYVDLDIGYRPRDWPAAFVTDYLDRGVAALRAHPETTVRMEATDTGRVHEAGEITPAAPVIAGPEYALLAWLLGRSDGGELTREGNGPLPEVPPLYAA